MSEAYQTVIQGQIDWYGIRIMDLKKQTEHFKECKKELEQRLIMYDLNEACRTS